MTTNDKPVCYQYQPRGANDWFSFNTAKERDEQMALVAGGYNGEMVARDLYDRPQPAAPQVPRRMNQFSTDPTPFREGYVEGWNACIEAMLATPPAPEQPKPECPCGEATCDEPWEPGCGLGRSEEHVGVYEQPKPAGDVEADAARYRWFTAENKAAWDKVIDAARLAAQPAQGEGEK